MKIDPLLWKEYADEITKANAEAIKDSWKADRDEMAAVDKRQREFEERPWYRRIGRSSPRDNYLYSRPHIVRVRPFTRPISIEGYLSWLAERTRPDDKP